MVFASMLDGPLRETLLAEGILVVVDVNLQIGAMQEAKWTIGFSRIVCNTISVRHHKNSVIHRSESEWYLHSEDEHDLAERICWCVEHCEDLSDMGIRVRVVYDTNFSLKAFEKK